MVAFLKLLEEKYGGVETYLETNLSFSLEDVSTIRQHVLIEVGRVSTEPCMSYL